MIDIQVSNIIKEMLHLQIRAEQKRFYNLLDSLYANSVLCKDITYLNYKNTRAYLSVIKETSSVKSVTYKVSLNLKIDFILDTVKQLDRSLLNDDSLLHRDQDSNYTSPLYSVVLAAYCITHAMTRGGKCTDNAPIESFSDI